MINILYDVISSDITSSFNSIFSLILNIFSYIFNQLNSITIGGVSLLQISITILILSAILPLLFTIASSSKNYAVSYSRNEKRKAERSKS